ncbi:hypothetical protein CDD82_1858 [Ophiocordyceps australis]|uniref:Arf-GAP domain-containing protein n=1 Tax=Ophiocordyceps australis TaxID=1399860 RepID=A0A2C5ZMU4_9HYPO|nr:hypothetical protein CDD82_1858 [Ophiocordyceps australis]
MSGALSKRQQARNEKLIHDLVQSVPGNNKCADCHMPNPAWASWSLGVFLCMRCAAIHRKLGTHVSKVKSLSMDSWSNEQIDNMRKVGNVVSNQLYNPENKKPPVPIDADEADSAMERFIRQKYVNNVASHLKKPPSLRSDEGVPPPLPPKNSSKFGFRSASSIFPLSSRARKEAKIAAVAGPRSDTSPITNKPSQVFGTSLDFDSPDDLERKLTKLRDMGFRDGQRNAIVLKGVNGNLERAIEALIRLGEGDGRPLAPSAISREGSLRLSRSLTPLSSKPAATVVGLSLPEKSAPDRPTTASTSSTNPFDALNVAQPQTAHSTGSLKNRNPYGNLSMASNPTGNPVQQIDLVSQAFQNLTVATPSQVILFPHRTGEVQAHAPLQQAPFPQFVPAASPSALQAQPINFQSSMTYPQPVQTSSQQSAFVHSSYNPFLPQSTGAPQVPAAMQQTSQIATGPAANNPFARSPSRMASPALGQIPEQGQTMFLSASPQPLATNTNPFFVNAPQQMATLWMQPLPGSGAHEQQAYSQPRRHDKASILALYDQPCRVPTTAQAPQQGSGAQPATIPEDQAVTTQPLMSAAASLPPNVNPFMNTGVLPASSGPLAAGRTPRCICKSQREAYVKTGHNGTFGSHIGAWFGVHIVQW